MLTGLWQVADLEREGPIDIGAAAAAMDAYSQAGFTTFDMADHYGSAEEIAGACASRAPHRDGDLQLLTKWTPAPGAHTPATVREAVRRSLDRLRADTIDLLQFHAWHYADPSWLDCLFVLQELKDEGLIRHLGLTNFDAVHVDMVLHTGIEVVSNQVSFSLLDGRAAGAMTDVCLEHGVQLLAYGTLAGGLLTRALAGRRRPRSGRRPNLVGDEVPPLRGGDGRLGSAADAAPGGPVGGREARRLNGQRRGARDPRPVRGGGRDHRRAAGAERAHRRQPAPLVAAAR